MFSAWLENSKLSRMTSIEQVKVSRQRWVPKLVFNALNLPTS